MTHCQLSPVPVPSSTLLWPPFDLDLISRKSYLSLFEGHFFSLAEPIDLETSLKVESLDMMSHKSQKPLFSLFFFNSLFRRRREKKTQKSETKEKFGALTGRLEKTCDESYSFGSLSEYRVRNRAERKKIKSRKNHKKE